MPLKPPPQPPPDILAAYKLQRDRDFEDPYTGAGPGGLAPDARYGSPKHRLIKVDAAEKAPEEPAPEQVRARRPARDQNDGYMEPYEAQKMMGSLEAPGQPLPLYDTPYEPVPNGLPPDSERSSCARPRESRLPQDDERPPEEYDQPWEWKKERISKAFAGEGGRARAWDLAALGGRGPSPALGERINPTLPLESQWSSHGFMHMKLSRTQEKKYVLGQNSPLFDSVPKIIHHYSSHKLPIKGAEHMSLLYPVAIRTL
uniref:Src homology 2 domain containing F n=1 Tax=Gopherus agassizii TaxID=38772 RepID=A0A452GUD5_9SAUR